MFNYDHTAISVKNLQATIDFYKLFGFEIYNQYDSDDIRIVVLKNAPPQNIMIELFNYAEFKPLPDSAKSFAIDLPIVGTKHMGFRVKDLDKAADFVIQNNIIDKIEIQPGRLGRRYFLITDPNGILVEIIEDKVLW